MRLPRVMANNTYVMYVCNITDVEPNTNFYSLTVPWIIFYLNTALKKLYLGLKPLIRPFVCGWHLNILFTNFYATPKTNSLVLSLLYISGIFIFLKGKTNTINWELFLPCDSTKAPNTSISSIYPHIFQLSCKLLMTSCAPDECCIFKTCILFKRM